MNPNDSKQIKRLERAIQGSRKKLRAHNDLRIDFIREYVGKHFGDGGADDKVPVNLLHLAISVYVRHLVASNPMTLVTTPYQQYKPTAALLELACNHLFQQIRLKKTLQMAALGGMFGMSIVKIGLEHIAQVEANGFLHDVGQPFADVVSNDDWVHDVTATRYDQVSFCGNRYKLPYDVVMESPLYKKKVKARLKPTDLMPTDEDGAEKASMLGGEVNEGDEEFERRVEMWDIWLPRPGLMVTIATQQDLGMPLRIVEWEGPEFGPYHRLGFNDVPDNILPLPPAAILIDLHQLCNQIFNKLGRQALRQKSVLPIPGHATADAGRIVEAGDGQAFRTDSPNSPREVSYGGIDQSNFAFMLQLRQLFTYLGGNIDSLGGLAPQAETATAEQLMAMTASKLVASMQDRMIDFTGDIVRDLAWYLFTDPFIELPLTKRVAGTDISIPVTYTAEAREGEFLDYNFGIHPYSMQHQTPAGKLASILDIFGRVLAPGMQMMQAQGISIDFEKLMRYIAKYANIDELEDILIFAAGGTQPAAGPVGTPPQKSPVTHRTYERINRPGAHMAQQENVMARLAMGDRPQNDEVAAMFRPAG